MVISSKNKIISFSQPIDNQLKPKKFIDPFGTEIHTLAEKASRQLIDFLNNEEYWKDFPLFSDLKAFKRIGKMFGVLVVEDENGKIGFLAAFSGKLLGKNHYTHFVPPVYDMQIENGFYNKEEVVLLGITKEIKTLEQGEVYKTLLKNYERSSQLIESEWEKVKTRYKQNKVKRNVLKEKVQHNVEDVLTLDEIKKESIKANYTFKKEKLAYKEKLELCRAELNAYENRINHLKLIRKHRSKALQEKLYKQYQFFNKYKETKGLDTLFNHLDIPPSGSGECAAPKLFHYAFKYDLKPLCMAEFWWGRSPGSNQKLHEYYYPPCEEKCRPILTYMLKDV